MPRIPCWQVDAFTDRPFAGNPAAVVWLETNADPEWMQNVAAEMNLAETAFVRKLPDGYSLRWFTPTVEVDLCGHATLATAHALWTSGTVTDEPLRFHSRSGVLTCSRNGNLIELDFPATPPQETPVEPTALEALEVSKTVYFGRSKFDVIVQLPTAAEVHSLRPDLRKLATVTARGVIVTAASDDPGYDFISRFFGPQSGVDEDPVTGSAHCTLAPFWAERLGKTTFTAYQASRRGGVLHLRLNGDRVILGGHAVTVWEGHLLASSEINKTQ
ncbi:MAG: PhzF family phenazine biosynthesis protein [Fimbriiglobus sp.]|nr:PhzF family phenazine biosynthesis protein [Fimbriiglobus sp.]